MIYELKKEEMINFTTQFLHDEVFIIDYHFY